MTAVPPDVGECARRRTTRFVSTAVVSRTRATLDIPEMDRADTVGSAPLRLLMASNPAPVFPHSRGRLREPSAGTAPAEPVRFGPGMRHQPNVFGHPERTLQMEETQANGASWQRKIASDSASSHWLTTGFGTPSVSGGRRPSLLFGRGVEVGLAHRAARLGTWPKTRSWRS